MSDQMKLEYELRKSAGLELVVYRNNAEIDRLRQLVTAQADAMTELVIAATVISYIHNDVITDSRKQCDEATYGKNDGMRQMYLGARLAEQTRIRAAIQNCKDVQSSREHG